MPSKVRSLSVAETLGTTIAAAYSLEPNRTLTLKVTPTSVGGMVSTHLPVTTSGARQSNREHEPACVGW